MRITTLCARHGAQRRRRLRQLRRAALRPGNRGVPDACLPFQRRGGRPGCRTALRPRRTPSCTSHSDACRSLHHAARWPSRSRGVPSKRPGRGGIVSDTGVFPSMPALYARRRCFARFLFVIRPIFKLMSVLLADGVPAPSTMRRRKGLNAASNRRWPTSRKPKEERGAVFHRAATPGRCDGDGRVRGRRVPRRAYRIATRGPAPGGHPRIGDVHDRAGRRTRHRAPGGVHLSRGTSASRTRV